MAIFANRRDAGARLALELQGYAERPDVVVVAEPHGGIPVGYEIAVRLGLPLVVFDVSLEAFAPGQTVIVAVDAVERVATILPMLIALRRSRLDRLVVTIPVASVDACATLRSYVDEVVCLVRTGRPIELSYGDLSPETNANARRLVQHAARSWKELSLHGSRRW